MDNGSELLSIREFAKKAGVSRQRVYSLLSSKLSPYCQEVDNQKMLDSSALSLFTVNGLTVNLTTEKPVETVNLTGVDSQLDNTAIDALKAVINSQQARISELEEELTRLHSEKQGASLFGEEQRKRREDAEKAAAIAAAERDAERKRADESAAALASALDAVKAAQQHADTLAQALQAAQIVQAGQIRLAMNESAEDAAADHTEDNTQTGTQTETGKRRGLFARLFHIGV